MEQMQVAVASGVDSAVLVAIELSKLNWLLAVHDPVTGKVSRRRVDGSDAAALVGVLERCRRDAQERAGAAIRVEIECVFEAGYDGVGCIVAWPQAGIAWRVIDPPCLEDGPDDGQAEAILGWVQGEGGIGCAAG